MIPGVEEGIDILWNRRLRRIFKIRWQSTPSIKKNKTNILEMLRREKTSQVARRREVDWSCAEEGQEKRLMEEEEAAQKHLEANVGGRVQCCGIEHMDLRTSCSCRPN